MRVYGLLFIRIIHEPRFIYACPRAGLLSHAIFLKILGIFLIGTWRYAIPTSASYICENCSACGCIRGVPGGKVSILGGHNIGHSKQKKK
jgi:hypothetical protein